MLADPPLSRGFNLKPHVVQPRSEGTVELISPDPREKPRIDPQYLSDSVGSHGLIDNPGRAPDPLEQSVGSGCCVGVRGSWTLLLAIIHCWLELWCYGAGRGRLALLGGRHPYCTCRCVSASF